MDKTRKKQVRKYIALGCAALLVALLAAMPLLVSPAAVEDGPQASILSAQAERRDIDRMLIGGGTLASQQTLELTIPAEVKLEAYLVGNGDVVSQGDAIATVDKVSVMQVIVQVQETLDYLEAEIQDASDDVMSESVTAGTAGTVKKIYAETGDDVRDVMLEQGALALLSLDGTMSVKISRQTKLAEGDTVLVTVGDDTEVTGTVISNINGELVVTVEDEGYEEGTQVRVTSEEGDRIGTGSLYITSPWTAHGYSGTVFSVQVKEGQTVYSGQTLFRLTDTGHTAQYRQLTAQRQEYEEMIRDLFGMYRSGVITAPCDGIVSGVDPDGDFLLQESDSGMKTLLAAVFTASGSNDTAEPEGPPEGGEGGNGGENGSGGEGENGGEGGSGGEETALTYTSYIAQVVSVGEDGTVTVMQDGGTTFTNFAQLPPVPENPVLEQEATYSAAVLGQVAQGDLLRIIKDSAGTVIQVVNLSGSGSGMPGGTMPEGNMDGEMSGMPSGMGGSMGGGTAAAVFEPYSLDTLTVATVTSQETMTLEITVDEADVLLLRQGQTAQLLVTPLVGQSFEAVITRISNDGVNDGGRSKFTVTASVPKHADMYPGMTGALLLSVDTVEQVTAIPVAALVEQGTKTLVYTGYDEETDTLTGPVEVTTGISDGEYVEVSGLEEGQTVWYEYYDTLEFSLTPESGGMFR